MPCRSWYWRWHSDCAWKGSRWPSQRSPSRLGTSAVILMYSWSSYCHAHSPRRRGWPDACLMRSGVVSEMERADSATLQRATHCMRGSHQVHTSEVALLSRAFCCGEALHVLTGVDSRQRTLWCSMIKFRTSSRAHQTAHDANQERMLADSSPVPHGYGCALWADTHKRPLGTVSSLRLCDQQPL